MADLKIDIEKLISDFEQGADEADELAREIHGTPVPLAGDPEKLIQGVAENLSKMSTAVGLPSRGPSYFEEQIKRHQKLTDPLD